MEDCLYFVLVGSTPLAVANSITWFLRMKPEYRMKEVLFICSQDDGYHGITGTAVQISQIKELIRESCKQLGLSVFNQISFNEEVILIPEADLPEAAKIIGKAVLSQKALTTVLDITAGRKIMSSASVIAGIFVHKFRERRLFFYYYWLLHYIPSQLAKKAYQLGLDEANLVFFPVSDILSALEQIQGKTHAVDK